MTAPKTYAADQPRACLKCRTLRPQEGGKGTGKQWRCASCSMGRTLAMQKRRDEQRQAA